MIKEILKRLDNIDYNIEKIEEEIDYMNQNAISKEEEEAYFKHIELRNQYEDI